MPGVGAKSAQRMAFHILERDRAGARRLAEKLEAAAERIGNCTRCRTFSEESVCALCSHPSRDASLLCVVETPADQMAIEQATGFRGRYFVLLGRLSPLDGLGPKEIGLDFLAAATRRRRSEGTDHRDQPDRGRRSDRALLSQIARQAGVRATRLAHGVPLGGELEFIDRGTLAHAFGGRHDIETDRSASWPTRLFGKIIRQEIPADIVYEDDEVLAFRDINPQAPVHVLFIPKRAIATLNDATENDAELIGKLVIAATAWAKKQGFADDGYRLVMNYQHARRADRVPHPSASARRAANDVAARLTHCASYTRAAARARSPPAASRNTDRARTPERIEKYGTDCNKAADMSRFGHR